MAMLTGVKQIYPLGIYLVSEDGGARDVTYNTACHSVEEDIMKVCILIVLHSFSIIRDIISYSADCIKLEYKSEDLEEKKKRKIQRVQSNKNTIIPKHHTNKS